MTSTISALAFTAPTGADATNFKTEFLKFADASNEYEMSVWLYADTDFDRWKAAVQATSASPTESEKEYANSYSSYTLRIYCNIKEVANIDHTSNRVESGCCLRDASQKGGGYCMKLGQNSVTSLYLNDA